MILHKFETADGEMLFELKEYDGCIVPSGHYYETDNWSKWKATQALLETSVFPILQELIDEVIPKYFEFDENTFSVKVYASRSSIFIPAKNYFIALKILNEEFEGWDTKNFEFFINIEFVHEAIFLDVKSYGCQIAVSIGDETIQDTIDEQDYRIWYLYIGDQKTPIDVPFNPKQKDRIISYYLKYLYQSEE